LSESQRLDYGKIVGIGWASHFILERRWYDRRRSLKDECLSHAAAIRDCEATRSGRWISAVPIPERAEALGDGSEKTPSGPMLFEMPTSEVARADSERSFFSKNESDEFALQAWTR